MAATQADHKANRQRGPNADQWSLAGKIPGDADKIDQLPLGTIEVCASFLLKVAGEILQLVADPVGMACCRTAKVVDRIRGGLLQARHIPLAGRKEGA